MHAGVMDERLAQDEVVLLRSMSDTGREKATG